MTAPLHLAWLIWGDEGGGVATAVRNHTARMAALGQRVTVLSFGPGVLADALAQAGHEVRPLGEPAETHRRYAAYGFSPLGVLRRGRVALRLRGVLRRALGEPALDADVLTLPWADLIPLAGPVTKPRGIGLVMEMPSAPSRYRFDLNQRIYAWMVRRWRVRILANSDYTARGLSRVPGVTVLTPAVDAARFDPARVVAVPRAALGLPGDALVLGLVARFDPAKGADLAIAALATLAGAEPRLHLLLVGGPLDAPWTQTLREQAEAAGIAARLHLVGAVPDPERYWAACDLALNAYKGAEAFGLSLVEAMLMRLPVIAHARGEPASTVEDGQTGWLFPEPTAAALTAALRRALAVRADWPAMGGRARIRAIQRFASDDLPARHLSLLRAQAEAARR